MRTLAETYLRNRGITPLPEDNTLRFNPRCYYRPDEHSPAEAWPAMIAGVTDLDGHVTGVHRTWLDPEGFDPVRLGKAPIDTPRRAMGKLLGHAVRFRVANDVLATGEGIETMLSLRCVLPSLPMAAPCRPITSPHFCCRRHCAGSTSLGTMMRPARWPRQH